MDKEQAIHSFWSKFGLTAYDTYSVPDNAMLPYITYDVIVDSFGNEVILSGSLWYKSTSWKDITNLTHEISKDIGHGGKVIVVDDGYIWIKRGQPFAQRMGDENKNIKRIYINLSIVYFTEY